MRHQGLIATFCFCFCLGLAGCASVAPDTSPTAPTATIQSHSTFGGLVLPTVTGDETLYYRADRKRSTNDYQFGNWLLQHTMGHFSSGNEDIVRLDKDLQWTLDKRDKSYTECPVGGCLFKGTASKPEATEQPAAHEDSCKRTLKRNEFKTVSGSEHRTILGMDTHQYITTWVVELRDAQNHAATNTVTFDFRTAEPAGVLKQALVTETTFSKGYMAALENRNPGFMALNRDVLAALGKLGNSAGLHGEKLALAIAHEMQKIKGYPLAISVEWRATDTTCGAQMPTTATATPATTTAASPMDWLGQKAAQSLVTPSDPNEALMHFSREITAVSMDPVHDSVFEVPAGYTLRKLSGQ